MSVTLSVQLGFRHFSTSAPFSACTLSIPEAFFGTFPSADTSTLSSATIHKPPKFPPVLVLPITSTFGQLLTSSVNLTQKQYNYILYNLKTKIQLIVLRCLTQTKKDKQETLMNSLHLRLNQETFSRTFARHPEMNKT